MDPHDRNAPSEHPEFVFYPADAQEPGEQLSSGPEPRTPAPAARPRASRRTLVGSAAAALLAVVVGGGAITAVKGNDSAAASTASSTTRTSAGLGAPGGGLPSGGGPGGGMAGETHVSGTVVSVAASSLRVKSSDGTTATYAVDASTQVLDDGSAVSVTSLQTGDTVLVHAIASTSGGTAYAERVLAGSSATDGPGAGQLPGGAPDGSAPSDAAPSDATTA
ncbi:hypothetical protein CLV35_0859 [Motilibacter peucedani]|uniref:DUF5666 domain-containing protein n=1 Tax=Motilibacter peucedani TaxID=598650 RepID=A0A420XUI8_9ACTN|nr:hypothetical protein [Motilibacter peucedani]RKS80427.1 hypothetical protein CLV35_0859 [Motilibacter peucedani]